MAFGEDVRHSLEDTMVDDRAWEVIPGRVVLNVRACRVNVGPDSGTVGRACDGDGVASWPWLLSTPGRQGGDEKVLRWQDRGEFGLIGLERTRCPPYLETLCCCIGKRDPAASCKRRCARCAGAAFGFMTYMTTARGLKRTDAVYSTSCPLISMNHDRTVIMRRPLYTIRV